MFKTFTNIIPSKPYHWKQINLSNDKKITIILRLPLRICSWKCSQLRLRNIIKLNKQRRQGWRERIWTESIQSRLMVQRATEKEMNDVSKQKGSENTIALYNLLFPFWNFILFPPSLPSLKRNILGSSPFQISSISRI